MQDDAVAGAVGAAVADVVVAAVSPLAMKAAAARAVMVRERVDTFLLVYGDHRCGLGGCAGAGSL